MPNAMNIFMAFGIWGLAFGIWEPQTPNAMMEMFMAFGVWAFQMPNAMNIFMALGIRQMPWISSWRLAFGNPKRQMPKTHCDRAVQRGRELRSDYKMVARALTRKGTALTKMAKTSKDYEPAIAVFQKARTEHRNADILKKLNDALKAKKYLEKQ
ncbi:hypothetical protein RD792_017124 [Penstemon davidsonii]|uniref:Uncharacterized protein n=1 Tax=Penstemon davidsonii TaxID=160366 RepID=A0ABR0CN17_9LAMI|nr:hypothetical protein RD792_017124 [Penstemon davidsonii]